MLQVAPCAVEVSGKQPTPLSSETTDWTKPQLLFEPHSALPRQATVHPAPVMQSPPWQPALLLQPALTPPLPPVEPQ